MAKTQAEMRVHMDRPYTYQLPDKRKRTLPTGWTGRVPATEARKIAKEGFGRILPEPKPAAAPAKETGKGKEAAAEKEPEKDASETSGEGDGSEQTDPDAAED